MKILSIDLSIEKLKPLDIVANQRFAYATKSLISCRENAIKSSIWRTQNAIKSSIWRTQNETFCCGTFLHVSWSQLTNFVSYKAEEAGKRVEFVNPKNTSQECSNCGEIVKKPLSQKGT
ncbi:MAG: Putative transposase DNA-binding domain protein [Candidatus Methanolliviera sp. GoM_oil]|nr:MAG: Putative transposase DNA-binding domain protein [Candidatus Methanolliviera sp. GoM_oil]